MGYPSTFEQNLAIEELGGTLFAATSADTTEFEITLPRETLTEGTRLLATILSRPLFKDIEIERSIIAEEVLEDVDEQGNSIDIDFLSRKRLWPNHPLGQSITGDIRNIEAFDVRDIAEHFSRSYVATNTVVCLSGGFDETGLQKIAAEAFSVLPREGAMPLFASPKLARGPSIAHVHKPGSQTQLRLAFHAPGEDASAHIPLLILLGILDDGMSTRLHRRIFDELGLAYNVSANLESYNDVAAFNLDVTASHKNTPEVVRQLLQLVDELRSNRVDFRELEKAQKRAEWGLDEYLDDPHAMASWYGEQALFRPPPTLASRKSAFCAVTPEDILHVAKDVFDAANLHVTTVGGVTSRVAREIEAIIARF